MGKLGIVMLISRCLAALAAAGGLCVAFTAAAEEEVLLRKSMDFAYCASSIAGMLKSIEAAPEQVRIEVDTGAIYRVRLTASKANLVFRCGKSDGFIEVVRTTPGEQVAATE